MEEGNKGSSNSSAAPSKDPGWNYVVLETPGNKNNLISNFCKVVTKGGIRRAKEHIVGGFRNTKIYKQCPPNVREEIAKYMQEKQKVNLARRTLLNFLVNSPKGSVFIESVDASNYAKTGEKLFQLINAFLERVGEENVFQIITDNASNMVSAGIHSKRRSSFQPSKLNEVVFVKYNRALQRRYLERETIDPISLKEIDESCEWLTGRMVDDSDEEEGAEDDFVFEGESLTWDQVSKAMGADEPAYTTRENVGRSTMPSSSCSRPPRQGNKGKGKEVNKVKGKEKAAPKKNTLSGGLKSLLRLRDEDEDDCEASGEESEGEEGEEEFREDIRFFDFNEESDDFSGDD
ncbi:hypothetical protein OROHE_018924 [Orobanche hederae]